MTAFVLHPGAPLKNLRGPAMSDAVPKAADLVSPFLLRIRWKGGAVTEHKARDLRLLCPCASCIEEGTGRKILDPATVPEQILLLSVELVGRYALTFVWSDGHKTGIFSFELLRQTGTEVASGGGQGGTASPSAGSTS